MVSVQAPGAVNSPTKSVSREVQPWAQLITLQHPQGQGFRSDLFHWLSDQFPEGRPNSGGFPKLTSDLLNPNF